MLKYTSCFYYCLSCICIICIFICFYYHKLNACDDHIRFPQLTEIDQSFVLSERSLSSNKSPTV